MDGVALIYLITAAELIGLVVMGYALDARVARQNREAKIDSYRRKCRRKGR